MLIDFQHLENTFFYNLKREGDKIALISTFWVLMFLTLMTLVLRFWFGENLFSSYLMLLPLVVLIVFIVFQVSYRKNLQNKISNHQKLAKQLINSYSFHPKYFNDFAEKNNISHRYNYNTRYSIDLRIKSQDRFEEPELSDLKLKFEEDCEQVLSFIMYCFKAGYDLEKGYEYKKALIYYDQLKIFLKLMINEIEKSEILSILNNKIDFKNWEIINLSLIEIDLRCSKIFLDLYEPITALAFSKRTQAKQEKFFNNFGDTRETLPPINPITGYGNQIKPIDISILFAKWYEILSLNQKEEYYSKTLVKSKLISFIETFNEHTVQDEPLNFSYPNSMKNECNIYGRYSNINIFLKDSLLLLKKLDNPPLIDQKLLIYPFYFISKVLNYFGKESIGSSMKRDLLGEEWDLEKKDLC